MIQHAANRAATKVSLRIKSNETLLNSSGCGPEKCKTSHPLTGVCGCCQAATKGKPK